MTVPIPGAFFKPNLMLELSDGNVGTGCRVTDSSFIVTTLATHSYLFSPGCNRCLHDAERERKWSREVVFVASVWMEFLCFCLVA